MVGLLDLEIYNSIFNSTQENNNFELYKFPDEESGVVSYEKFRDEIEKDMGISDITATDLQYEIVCPIISDEYREQVTNRMEDGAYMNKLAGYRSSILQDFES